MKKIFKNFDVNEEFISAESIGNGNINETFLVKTNGEDKINCYILQKVNHHVFKNVDGLMQNIEFITSFLKNSSKNSKTQELVKTKNNQSYYLDKENYTYWRVYTYVENSITFDTITSPELFYKTGVAFGLFQKKLKNFDSDLLIETIADFHNTKKRYDTFLKQVNLDLSERSHLAKEEIDFIISRKKYASVIVDLLEDKTIPTRVTHNDTKLNNILFDEVTGEVLTVVDLDTVMPGSILYDFGDAIRFGANQALEDEQDLSKVKIDLELFELFTEGFLKHTINMMNEKEIELLAFSSILITYELAIRFLGDYLDGDLYFKTKHPDHNLQRAKSQIALVKDMEKNLDKMEEITKRISAQLLK